MGMKRKLGYTTTITVDVLTEEQEFVCNLTEVNTTMNTAEVIFDSIVADYESNGWTVFSGDDDIDVYCTHIRKVRELLHSAQDVTLKIERITVL